MKSIRHALNAEGEPENPELYFALIMMGFLTFFFVVGSLIEKYKPKIGHETAATVLFGKIFRLFFITYKAKPRPTTNFTISVRKCSSTLFCRLLSSTLGSI